MNLVYPTEAALNLVLGATYYHISPYLVTYENKDTLKSSPPENKSMKRASGVGVMTTTLFYVLCGIIGYAAFGNDAPGNFLTGFGFYEPFWLIDFANICIAVHLIGAYQVFAQPLFGFIEKLCTKCYPDNKFITSEHTINVPCAAFTISTSSSCYGRPRSFWPLTVYFTIEMHVAQSKIPKYSFRWVWLKILSWVCLIVSLIAAAGSVQGLISSLRAYKPFQTPKE
ncbi:Amino acid permease 1 [Hibiscus syriacus]|uniref:Amino acid permease 1 n=1 Tax=Hibiscus syriacus TaxID=106335 RepID=A0A6A2ZWL5_HIBSY|nr:Amino acid permease 1 [Hibiscus syriacus]